MPKEEITYAQVRAWRKQANMTQQELGEYLGLKKIAVTKIELGHRKISPSEQKLLRLLICGELPFDSSMVSIRNSELAFTEEQWEVVHFVAAREGYSDAKQWIVDKIKGYLRMNPVASSAQMAAEDSKPYNVD